MLSLPTHVLERGSQHPTSPWRRRRRRRGKRRRRRWRWRWKMEYLIYTQYAAIPVRQS